MTKKSLRIDAVVIVALLCGSVTLAQEPVQNINKGAHPHMAEAQRLVVQAYREIEIAQKANNYDMHGHAGKAEGLLKQVNEELKTCAEDADAAMSQQKK
jgi:hypothetical protein